ncbi:ComF family protein [Treponema rectale]|uniref:ComF family protein n=1 Tax=Treponema rectale TaxID=744512 RepID=A0A7M1XMS5_9SPIR|nr:ComF family protein [Treponema rectale]
MGILFRTLLFFKRWIYTVLTFFFSENRCICCNSPVYGGFLCASCLKNCASEITGNCSRCSVCGKPLLSETDICSDCRQKRILFSADGCFPLFTYRLWKKNMLFMWKMQNERSLSFVFAYFAASAMRKLYPEGNYPAICGVPPRPGKLRERGWDQIKELCFYLKVLYGFRICSLLVRVNRKQQKKLDRAARIKQMEGSYVLRNSCRIPERVVLIDDVFTTGSTAESCCALLKKAGVRNVKVLTLFIVD